MKRFIKVTVAVCALLASAGAQTITGPISPTRINEKVNAAAGSGDACARLTVALTRVASGGVIEQGLLSGAQTCAAKVVISKPVHIYLGSKTVTCADASGTCFDVQSSGVIIDGEQGNTTLINGAASPTTQLIRVGTGMSSISDVTIRGITFDGNNQNGGIGVSLPSDTNVGARIAVERNRFQNMNIATGLEAQRSGIRFISGTFQDVRVANNTFSTVGLGLVLYNGQGVLVEGNAGDTFTVGNYLSFTYTGSVAGRDVIVRNNRGKGFMRMFAEVFGNAGSNAVFDGNYGRDWSGCTVSCMGISFPGANAGARIIGNDFDTLTPIGTVIGAAYGLEVGPDAEIIANRIAGFPTCIIANSNIRMSIVGNNLYNCVTGVTTTGTSALSTDVTIANNKIRDMRDAGIALSSSAVVIGNVITRTVAWPSDATGIYKGLALATPEKPEIVSGNSITQAQTTPTAGWSFRAVFVSASSAGKHAGTQVTNNLIVNQGSTQFGTGFWGNSAGSMQGMILTANTTQNLASVFVAGFADAITGGLNYDTGSTTTTAPGGYYGIAAPGLVTSFNTMGFSATPTFDFSKGGTEKITLSANVTSSTIANATAGQRITFMVCQNATGGFTFTWPTNVKGASAMGTTANTCSTQTFVFDGSNAYALGPAANNQ